MVEKELRLKHFILYKYQIKIDHKLKCKMSNCRSLQKRHKDIFFLEYKASKEFLNVNTYA